MTTAHQLARTLLSGPDHLLVVSSGKAVAGSFGTATGASQVQTVEVVGDLLQRGAYTTAPAVVLTLEPELFSY